MELPDGFPRAAGPMVGPVIGVDENGRAIQVDPSVVWREPDPRQLKVLGEAQRKALTKAQKIRQFFRVTWGKLVVEDVFRERMVVCEKCPAVRRENERLYCGACGCWQWRLAELTRKLWYAKLPCPNNRFTPVTDRRLWASRRQVREIKRRLAAGNGE